MLMDNIDGDIIVVGAGSAGIAAAVAAAESGMNVVLVERYGFTGGLATAAEVGTICGVYYRTEGIHHAPCYAVQGFARQFSEAVMNKSRRQPCVFSEGLHFIPYQPDVFHHQAVLALKQAGVKLLLHTSVVSVVIMEGKITELILNTRDRVFCAKPQSVVDCSGNAQISMLSGLSVMKQPDNPAAAFVFKVIGLPDMDARTLSLNLIRWIKRGIEQGAIDQPCEKISLVPASVHQGLGLFKLGLSNCSSLSEYEIEARSRSDELVNYLRDADPLLKALSIVSMAAQVGLRIEARHEGMAVLDENHVMSCAKPRDGVAVGAWPIEYWGDDRKPDMSYFKANDHYLISAGTLVSKHVDNLFFAGRTMSATERAIASARVIGTCLSTGYASGKLAAEYVQKGSWETAIKTIRVQQGIEVKD
jgi:hypothetical protein